MTQGYGSNFAVVIEEEKIKEMNLGSYTNFLQSLKERKVSLESYAISTKNDDVIYNEDNEEVKDHEIVDGAFEWFQEEFKEKTGVGIGISYHSIGDEGDKYDEVDGHYFYLDFDDVFHMTPQAKELQEKTDFDMKFFVTYG